MRHGLDQGEQMTKKPGFRVGLSTKIVLFLVLQRYWRVDLAAGAVKA